MEEGGGGSSGRGEEKYKEFENQRKSDRDIDSEYQILCIWETEKKWERYWLLLPNFALAVKNWNIMHLLQGVPEKTLL